MDVNLGKSNYDMDIFLTVMEPHFGVISMECPVRICEVDKRYNIFDSHTGKDLNQTSHSENIALFNENDFLLET